MYPNTTTYVPKYNNVCTQNTTTYVPNTTTDLHIKQRNKNNVVLFGGL